MSFYSKFSSEYELIFPFREQTFSFLMNAANIPINSKLIDIGCGTGHYLARFADMGYSCLGIDLDSEMISNACTKYPSAQFRCMDMNNIDTLIENFNFAYCIGNVISHLSKEKLRLFAKKLNTILLVDSVVAIQTVNWDYLLSNFKHFIFPDIHVSENTLIFRREYKPLSSDLAIFNTELVKNSKTLFKEETPLYPTTATEMTGIFAEGGFGLVAHYSDFQHTDFSAEKNSASVYIFNKLK